MNHLDHRSFDTTATFETARVDVWSIERNAVRLRSGFAGGYLARLGHALARLPQRLVLALRRHRAIAELSDLDDRLLADVGIRREDIVGLVSAGEPRRRAGERRDTAPFQVPTATVTAAQPAVPANSDHGTRQPRQVA